MLRTHSKGYEKSLLKFSIILPARFQSLLLTGAIQKLPIEVLLWLLWCELSDVLRWPAWARKHAGIYDNLFYLKLLGLGTLSQKYKMCIKVPTNEHCYAQTYSSPGCWFNHSVGISCFTFSRGYWNLSHVDDTFGILIFLHLSLIDVVNWIIDDSSVLLHSWW